MSLVPLYVIGAATVAAWISHRVTRSATLFAERKRLAPLVFPEDGGGIPITLRGGVVAPLEPAKAEPAPLRPKELPPLLSLTLGFSLGLVLQKASC